jgi:hypothetical protein
MRFEHAVHNPQARTRYANEHDYSAKGGIGGGPEEPPDFSQTVRFRDDSSRHRTKPQ